MKTVTTEDIIKMLPFEEDFKNDLLSNWDKLSEDQQFNITQRLWDTYSAVYEAQYETNMQAALLRIEEGTDHMDESLGKRIQEQTDKDMEEQFNKSVPQANLAEAREELQEILNNPNQQNHN